MTRRTLTLWPFLVLALVMTLGTSAAKEKKKKEADAEEPATPTPVRIFPVAPTLEPHDVVRFSHKKHLRFGDTCRDCHEDLEDTTTAEESKGLGKDYCWECHDEEDDGENCEMCHTGETPSAKFIRREEDLKFNHKAHLELDDVDCVTCHIAVPESTEATDSLVPPMDTCVTCHEPDMNRLACRTCHLTLPDMKKWPTGELLHGPGWMPMHGAFARGTSGQCAECHEPTFCTDCHAATNIVPPSDLAPMKVDRGFIHRGDFVGRHAMASKASPGTCQTCHGQTFCSDCHSAAQAEKGPGAASPHPPGFLLGTGGAFHGTEARRRPDQCATCHDQGAASSCVDCHRVGGPGGDPHPPGWNASRRHDQRQQSAACLPCHGMQ